MRPIRDHRRPPLHASALQAAVPTLMPSRRLHALRGTPVSLRSSMPPAQRLSEPPARDESHERSELRCPRRRRRATPPLPIPFLAALISAPPLRHVSTCLLAPSLRPCPRRCRLRSGKSSIHRRNPPSDAVLLAATTRRNPTIISRQTRQTRRAHRRRRRYGTRLMATCIRKKSSTSTSTMAVHCGLALSRSWGTRARRLRRALPGQRGTHLMAICIQKKSSTSTLTTAAHRGLALSRQRTHRLRRPRAHSRRGTRAHRLRRTLSRRPRRALSRQRSMRRMVSCTRKPSSTSTMVMAAPLGVRLQDIMTALTLQILRAPCILPVVSPMMISCGMRRTSRPTRSHCPRCVLCHCIHRRPLCADPNSPYQWPPSSRAVPLVGVPESDETSAASTPPLSERQVSVGECRRRYQLQRLPSSRYSQSPSISLQPSSPSPSQ